MDIGVVNLLDLAGHRGTEKSFLGAKEPSCSQEAITAEQSGVAVLQR